MKNRKIIEGSFDNSKIIRTATISQKNKLLILTFKRNIPQQNATISLVFNENGEETEISFNITIQTAEPPKEEVNSSDISNSSLSTNESISLSISGEIGDAAQDVLERLQGDSSRNRRNLLSITKSNVRKI